jgi:hypothetical protein
MIETVKVKSNMQKKNMLRLHADLVCLVMAHTTLVNSSSNCFCYFPMVQTANTKKERRERKTRKFLIFTNNELICLMGDCVRNMNWRKPVHILINDLYVLIGRRNKVKLIYNVPSFR